MGAVRTDRLRPLVTILAMAALALSGCNDDNATNGTSQGGTMVLIMHDAPMDNFREAWVTVESVTMIGDEDDNTSDEIVLVEPVRMDLLSLDSAALLLAVADVDAGAYSKIRLQVSDPEFVRNDDSVFAGEDIKLVANGQVDLNTQGDVFVVADDITVVSLDLDVDNSLQINQTGNGRYILRPQIFVDNETSGEEGIIIDGAVITLVDLNAGRFTIVMPPPQAQSDMDLIVITTSHTEISATGGAPLALATLMLGSTVDIVGAINMETGVITASRIQVVI